MLICSTCGSSDIKQEASIMLDPNFPYLGKDYTAEWWKDFIWNDFYRCNNCDDECETIEVGIDGFLRRTK